MNLGKDLNEEFWNFTGVSLWLSLDEFLRERSSFRPLFWSLQDYLQDHLGNSLFDSLRFTLKSSLKDSLRR